MNPLHAVLSPAWPGASAEHGSQILLLLHGLGSHEYDLPELMPHLGEGTEWASLRGPVEMDHGGASWFPLTSPVEPDRAGVEAATSAIWDWVEENVPTASPIVPIGFSQGAFMAIELLRTRPERIRATVLLSGLMAEDERPGDAALGASRPPVFWGRGTHDTMIWPEAVERMGAWLHAHTALTERVYPGLGHGVNDAEMRDVRAFLSTHVAAARG